MTLLAPVSAPSQDLPSLIDRWRTNTTPRRREVRWQADRCALTSFTIPTMLAPPLQQILACAATRSMKHAEADRLDALFAAITSSDPGADMLTDGVMA